MMNPELKTQWIEALRSGKYPQGRAHLCKNGSYCCLGVLADIQGRLVDDPQKPELKAVVREKRSGERGSINDYFTGLLPNDDSVRGGIEDQDMWQLVAQNDNEDRTFNQIADWIEENL